MKWSFACRLGIGCLLWPVAAFPQSVPEEDRCPVHTPPAVVDAEDQAEITRGLQHLRSDHIEYAETDNRILLRGNVHLWDQTLFVRGEKADIDLAAEQASLFTIDYILQDGAARGLAARADWIFNVQTLLQDAMYTPCVGENPAWTLRAKRLRVDHEEERVYARHVTLWLRRWPVFYSPWLSFPTSERRKSGFLAPSFGNSKRNGLELETPWYWNIAPNQDAILSPRWLSDNGVIWQGQYRYLLQSGQGNVSLEYLPSDTHQHRDTHRGLFSLRHEQGLMQGRGRVGIDFAWASDPDYFNDFGNRLTLTSLYYLERLFEAQYRDHRGGADYTATLHIQDYQSVAAGLTTTPYKRLPQLRFQHRSRPQDRSINYHIDSELVYFTRDADTATEDVDGMRFDLYPQLSYPVYNRSGFIVPKLGLRYTQYRLWDRHGPRGQEQFRSSPSRLVPVLSVDSGLFFERRFGEASAHLHTLEPRLFYLYIPEVQQTGLPVFDSAVRTFGYDTLFHENHFSGKDRINDAHQIGVSLRSAWFHGSDNREWAKMELGQLFYLRDRRVRLPDRILRQEATSPLILDVALYPDRAWIVRGTGQWDLHGGGKGRFYGHVRYLPSDRPGANPVFNLSYRNNQADAEVDQLNMSLYWPLQARWGVVSRWNHSLPEGRSLESFLGVEYNGCCLGVAVVLRRFLVGSDGLYQNGLFLNLQFKGLSGIGGRTSDFLRANIPGYVQRF